MITRLNGLPGGSLLEILRRSGRALQAPCAGRGTCGKCRVRVEETAAASPLDALSPGEREQLSAAETSRGVRLACLARFVQAGAVDIELGDDGIAIPVEALEVSFDTDVRQAAIASGRTLRVAIDLGTTTLALCLVDARTDVVLAVRTETNAQRSWGADVVARIQSVVDGEGSFPQEIPRSRALFLRSRARAQVKPARASPAAFGDRSRERSPVPDDLCRMHVLSRACGGGALRKY